MATPNSTDFSDNPLRARARDDLREQARALRSQGLTYDRIQQRLGCSKSSISLWVRDLPRPPRRDPREQGLLAARKRWDRELPIRDEERQRTKEAALAEIGTMTDRELFMAGVALYWAEGSKDKTYARRERAVFINSDPDVIGLYLAWLDLLGIERDRLRFRLSIHETADVPGAESYWAALTRMDRSQFQRATLKKHNPRTLRKNSGENYRGCLIIAVQQSADLYRRIEGWWCGIVRDATKAGR
ncbi:hypothetical protein AB0910_18615 [Streptomyces sp. NPDC047002]|uniref:hypothetical protein n=1 Tax=Streptomyces sp. NPDC047002 TaxID=3155475 RepID=UPI00345588FC